MLLRIILSEDDIRRVTIDNLPENVDDFYLIIKTKLGMEGDFVIQYQDPDIGTRLHPWVVLLKFSLKIKMGSIRQKLWPALFTEQQPQIEAEFAQLTSVDLKSSFLTGLDQYLARFLELYKTKSSIVGLTRLMRCLDDDSSTQRRRTVLLLGLPHFLKEDPSCVFKTVEATDDEATFTQGMKIGVVMVKDGEDIIATSVILEEGVILPDVKDIPYAIALLMGLLFALNIDYPKELSLSWSLVSDI
ncbi:hypothetical protein MATL_G00101260 [Megalops atlanticus]|uniref:Uncharacterized protein n=1 Tax=Megalops atlanticus TaxID=7932 RepID=A0A9D3Q3Q3_MEGAT|nr:hypothetical protein MATL_G00101260 [Megalops atlanticus]